jgi:hypothetical protein
MLAPLAFWTHCDWVSWGCPLHKLVVIVGNTCPGTIIVVVLKANPDLSETVAVAKVYFPSYLLSIAT